MIENNVFCIVMKFTENMLLYYPSFNLARPMNTHTHTHKSFFEAINKRKKIIRVCFACFVFSLQNFMFNN